MIVRIDKLPIDLPTPKNPSPNSASAVQELLGGKFGEMSTLMNYTFQSFNFRGRNKLRPYYDLIANIAAEEFSHIELVSYTINLLLSGSSKRGTNPAATPLKDNVDVRNHYHYIASGQTALPVTRWATRGRAPTSSRAATTGADLSKLFPVPDISNKKFPEARKWEEKGLHRIMFQWSPNDYKRVGEVWRGGEGA